MTIAQIYEKAKQQLDKDEITIGEFSEIVDREYQEQRKWIPVSERLPEENIHVLCQFYMGGMAECYHAHGAWHIVGGYRISCDEVVAWMPLPQPYTESEDKE